MTAVKRISKWSVNYRHECRLNVICLENLNKRVPVYTRQLTDYEMKEIFENKNYNYIKNIGRDIDGYEWKELTKY